MTNNHCGAQKSYRIKLSEKMGKENLFYFEIGQDFLAAGVKRLNSNVKTEFGLISWYCSPSFPKKERSCHST